MTPQQFLYAVLVAAAITVGVLMIGLGAVVRRSSRLTAIQMGGATAAGLVGLVAAMYLVVQWLDR